MVQVWFPGSDPSHPALQTSNLPAELTLPRLTLILEFKHCEKQNVKYPGQDNIFNIYSENLPGMSLCAEKDFVEVE